MISIHICTFDSYAHYKARYNIRVVRSVAVCYHLIPDTYKTRVTERNTHKGSVESGKHLVCEIQGEGKPSTIQNYTWLKNGEVIGPGNGLLVDGENITFKVGIIISLADHHNQLIPIKATIMCIYQKMSF